MIETDIWVGPGYTTEQLREALCASLPLSVGEVGEIRVLRQSLRAEQGRYGYRLRVGVCLSAEREAGLLRMRKRVFAPEDLSLSIPRGRRGARPLVVGGGPAGLFCALTLALGGCMPTVIERGAPVEQRCLDVKRFFDDGCLHPESNIQFGEGGAGAFSDGKLKVGGPDPVKQYILQTFVDCGADPSLLISDMPHMGTDVLHRVIISLRSKLLSLGVTMLYGTRMEALHIKQGRVAGVHATKNGGRELLEAEGVFLATGHSARDTYRSLAAQGVCMEAKPFGVGLRIEHAAAQIQSLRFGAQAAEFPAASYHLVTHLPSGRSVYSFCMCPGGTVVAAASEPGRVVTNGMSNSKRDGCNSNAALLVSVRPEDYGGGGDPLSGLRFQEQIEESTYRLGGGGFAAPAQTLGDFLRDRPTVGFGPVLPSYPRGTSPGRIDGALPGFVTDALRLAMGEFDRWMPGYGDPYAVLTASETRSTAPLRLLRTAAGEALLHPNLYPIGEGAGYGGGILSSAADGVRAALSYLQAKP